LSPRRDLDIENTLILGSDLTGSFKQNPELGIGMRRPDVGQNGPLTSMFTHNLHRYRTRGRAHLPHVRHRQNLPV